MYLSARFRKPRWNVCKRRSCGNDHLGLKHHFEGLIVCELLTIEHFVNAEVAFKPWKCGFEDPYVPNATSWERLVNSVLDQRSS